MWLTAFSRKMAIITLSNIKKSFGTRDLLRDVSFFINEHERVALIGANGTGKTTILRIISGEESYDAGTVSKEPGITVGYLPQEVDLPDVAPLHLSVMAVTPELFDCACELARIEQEMEQAASDQAHSLGIRYAEVSHRFDNLHGFDYQIKAKAILIGLGFHESDFNKPIQSLSGGQKTRAALARLLLLSPDILLLDEPTNHLDIQACEWLQTFLNEKYQGAALIVSHDRYFIDRVVSKVVEIDDQTAYTYPGNYSAYAKQKADRIEEQRKQYKLQQKEISRIETAIQTLFSDRKFSRRDNKIKQLQRISRITNPQDKRTIKLTFTETTRSGREVINIEGLTKTFPGKTLFNEFSITVERSQKVGIVGPNGSGKTTLLKILAGRSDADAGEVIFGHNVIPVYFAQEFDHLVPSRTVIEELLADADLTSGEARDLLAQFLFMGDDAFKKVEVLSGGELCRLALAKVLANNPNLLLLDEPTNHLDIRSREALEDALKAFNGTVLVASHDRYLLDAISSDILEIKDGTCTRYIGNYSSYKEKTAPLPEPVTPRYAPKKSPALPKRPDSPLKARQRLLKELVKQQKEFESAIEHTESRLNEITEALADEETYRNGTAGELSREFEDLTGKLNGFYSEWEQVCEQIAEVEADIRQQL